MHPVPFLCSPSGQRNQSPLWQRSIRRPQTLCSLPGRPCVGHTECVMCQGVCLRSSVDSCVNKSIFREKVRHANTLSCDSDESHAWRAAHTRAVREVPPGGPRAAGDQVPANSSGGVNNRPRHNREHSHLSFHRNGSIEETFSLL